MSSRAVAVTAVLTVAVVLAWVLFFVLPRKYGRRPPAAVSSAAIAAPAPQPPVGSGRKIKGHLYYVADDGQHLTSVERDIAYGEGTLEQARQIVLAQIAAVSDPLVSAIPQGTTLRALFLTEGGEAFVDFSRELSSAHPGGTISELLTIYTIVNAISENLPAVAKVQLLVDGKEVDTLAGHIDLRHPLAKNLTYVQ